MKEVLISSLFHQYKNLRFVNEFKSLGKANMAEPFVLRSYLGSSRAYHTWTFDFFRKKYGHILHQISRTYDRSFIKTVSLEDYIDHYVLKKPEASDDPYYMRSWQFIKDAPQLKHDIDVKKPENWLEEIPGEIMPEYEYRLIFIGGSGTTFRLHYDTMMVSSWSAVLQGTKLWIFFEHEAKNFLKNGDVDALQPSQNMLDDGDRLYPQIVLQERGDLVYTPSGWWHQVINLENTISYTENIVNRDNISEVIHYLKCDECQTYSGLTSEKAKFWTNVFSRLKAIKCEKAHQF